MSKSLDCNCGLCEAGEKAAGGRRGLGTIGAPGGRRAQWCGRDLAAQQATRKGVWPLEKLIHSFLGPLSHSLALSVWRPIRVGAASGGRSLLLTACSWNCLGAPHAASRLQSAKMEQAHIWAREEFQFRPEAGELVQSQHDKQWSPASLARQWT